jgi:hypothetical protein
MRKALQLANKAVVDLAQPTLSMRTEGALLLHFRSDGSEVRKIVAKRFENIAKRLSSGDDYFRSDGKNCRKSLAAYTTVGAQAHIYLCDDFFATEDDVQRGSLLIHELAHNFGASRSVPPDLRKEAPDWFGHIDPSQLQHEVYRLNHEYRVLGVTDAVATADAYRFFALDNMFGAGFSILSGLAEIRIGGVLPQVQQLSVSVRLTAEFEPVFLEVISPVLGVEFGLNIGSGATTIATTGTGGVQVGAGKPLYLDLRGGLYAAGSFPGGKQAGILWDASVHLHMGVFDISAFWEQYRTVLPKQTDQAIVGVGFNLRDLVDQWHQSLD